MALCSLSTRRLELPHEPGAWVEVRLLSANTVRKLDKDARAIAGDDDSDYGYEVMGAMLKTAVVSWSYEAPVTLENIDDLDLATAAWVAGELGKGADVPLPSSPPSTTSSTE
jgi:hypothetical protein